MSMRATDPGEGNQYAEQNVGLRDSDPTMSSSEAEGSQSRIGGQTPSHSSVAHATASLQRTAVRRNVITLGNTLPVELLINVFSFLVHGHVFAIQQLVRLSAVCSYWRRIAISYAPLWTNIELSQSSLAELAFERSQGLPVHLHLIPSNRRIMAKDYRRISKSIEEHAHRIVTIWFTMDPSKCASLFSRFSPTLPALRSMILECTRLVPSRPSEPALKMRLDRRTSIVHTTAPALRTLKITQLSLPWTLSMFRGLTALRIDGDECSETPKLSTFCHVLAACPDLESLTLVDTGPFNAHQFGVAPVSLPKLRLLTVRFGESFPLPANAVRMTCILSYLSLPPSADMHVMLFQLTPVLHDKLLARYKTLGLQYQEIVLSTGDTSDGVLRVNTGSHFAPLRARGYRAALFNIPTVEIIVIKSAHVWFWERELPNSTETDWHRLDVRTEGLSLSTAVELFRGGDIRGLKKLEMVDVPEWGAGEENLRDLERRANVLEVSYQMP